MTIITAWSRESYISSGSSSSSTEKRSKKRKTGGGNGTDERSDPPAASLSTDRVIMAIVDNADLEPVGGTLSGGGADQERRQPAAEAAAENGGVGGFKREMKDLEELFSKLNPMAEEFVPRSLSSRSGGGGRFYPDELAGGAHNGFGDGDANGFVTRRIYGINQGRRRMNIRTCMAQRADRIRKTVYVSDIDTLVTEEDLAALFARCGQVMDCRVCCDATSVLRFAFIEFEDEESARDALELTGTVLGFYPLKVLPSKTAIAPVDKKFLPKNEDERQMCMRTIYCTNINKKVTQTDLKIFFERICGEVHRLRLLGDYQHSTRMGFVEFVRAESAITALNCSGMVLKSLPLRISPSKTPVCSRASPRPPMH